MNQPSILLTDLYQLTMLQAYYDHGMEETAVFEFFVRKLPEDRNFLLAAGLEQVLDYLESARFTAEELSWLDATGRFNRRLLDALADWRFTGDVDAMAEGTPFFPGEPILNVVAPLPQAQLVETRIINLLQLQTMIAAKAARSVLAAGGRCWSTSACAAPTAPRPGCCRPAPATWPASAAPRPCWPASGGAFPCTAPWPIPTSRLTPPRSRPSRTSPAPTRKGRPS